MATSTLRVRRLVDDQAPYPVEGGYVQRFWLPVLGPAAIVTLRYFAHDLADVPVVEYQLAALAEALGLPGGTRRGGVSTRIEGTLDRLVAFGCARRCGEMFEVRAALHRVPARAMGRWSQALSLEHAAALSEAVIA